MYIKSRTEAAEIFFSERSDWISIIGMQTDEKGYKTNYINTRIKAKYYRSLEYTISINF
jgi:hypothetical protein